MDSQATQLDHKQYLSFEEKDKEGLHSLLFDALTIQPFDQVERLVHQLLDTGVPVTIKDKARSTPLAVAVKQKCSVNVIERLMVCTNLESLLQSQNKHKLTPIHEAALVNNHEALQMMINKLRGGLSVEVNHEDREEQIRSHHYGQPDATSDCYKLLNKKNKEGWTALHYAADRGHVDVLHILVMLEQCDVTVCNKNKKTAFHLAAKGGRLPCLKLLFVAVQCRGLLESLPKVDKNEWNLACHASAHMKGDIEVMEWLLRNMPGHADINHSTKKGYTPFLLACEYLNVELVKLLLSHEQLSEVTAVTTDGKTALHLAAIHDSVEIVQLLLDRGFPVDDTDKENGDTALHIACKKGSLKVENVLITEGADRTIVNKDGKLPKEVKYSDLRIPPEIKKRGDAAVKGYITALRKGKKKMPRCKLVILGEAGVGKTNLLNLLTGEKFVPTHEKTEGVDISLVTTFDIDTKTWRKNSGEGGDDEYTRIYATEVANRLNDPKPDHKDSVSPTPESLEQNFSLIMRKYAESKPKPNLRHTRHMANSQSTKYVQHVDDIDHVQTPKVQFAEQPIVFESESPAPLKSDAKATEKHSITVRVHSTNPQSTSHSRSQHGDAVVSQSLSSSSAQHMNAHTTETHPLSEAADISGSHDHFYTMILRKASKQKSSEPLTLHLKLTSFDFAGQEHYKSMHPCFMTSRAVYIVTFNARHLLPEAKYKYKCVEEINYWVNSVLVHVSTDPRVILVGTHRGPYDVTGGFDALTEKQKSFIYEILKKELKNQSVFKFFKGDKIMALVESSIENNEDISGAKVVREKLQSLGEGHPSNKDDLPLSYLRLESKIFEERSKRSKNKSFLVPRGELEQWANEFGIEDLKTALNFLHDIGIIVNPSCLPTLFLTKEDMEPLQDVVLIKPQWLADVMKELMKIDRGEKKFENMGRDVLEAIECLLKTGKADKKLVLFSLWQEHHNGSEQLFEQICLLLEVYGVIIPIKKENEIAECYYISCKLPQSENIPERTKNCHSFHVSFKDGLFPPFVLHQLMFKMYQDYSPSKYEFGKTECYMEYIEDCQWWLCQHSYDDIIKVAIRTKSKVRTILPAMQLLDRMLQKILKAEELNRICYKLGPVEMCSQCPGEQLQFFSYITYENKSDSQEQSNGSHISDCLKCSKCCNEVTIKCNLETDTIIKSKKYKYEKKFEEFKKDLNYNELNDKLKDHLTEQFQMDLPKDATGASDSKIIQRWYTYREHQDDPWPLVVTYLSCYDDAIKDFEIDRIKCKFLYMCDHCL